MKKIKYFTLLLVIFLITYSCSYDNYEAPNAVLSGRVIDNVTNELIENGGPNGGTLIHVFEGSSLQPIVCKSFPDGSFVNSAFFTGNYRVFAIGAFSMATDTIPITVTKNTEIDIKVIPNIRLKATLINSDQSTATVRVEYEKMHATQDIINLSVIWSTYPNPNMFTFTGGNLITEDVASQNLTKGELTFNITGLKPGEEYYFRAAGRTNAAGNYYNYSKVIQK